MSDLDDWIRCPTCGATHLSNFNVEKWPYGFSYECTECGDSLYWEI